MKRLIISYLFVTVLTSTALTQDEHAVFPGRAFLLGKSSVAMVVGDFDHDGYADVATAAKYAGTVSVAWGDGGGGLLDGPSYLVGSPTLITAGDLGSPSGCAPDGLTDLLVVRWHGTLGTHAINILYGLAGRQFVNVEVLQTGGEQDGIAIGDFNGDGYNDFAFRPHGVDAVKVVYGGPTGFEAPRNVNVGGRGYGGPVSADLNGDGRADLVVGYGYPLDGISVLYGDSEQGIFIREDYTYPLENEEPVVICLADFDGDGQFDAALAGLRSGTVYVFYGKTDGSFTDTPAAFSLGLRDVETMTAGDLDGDGRADIVARERRQLRSVVLYGRSGQQFSEPIAFIPTGFDPLRMAVWDVDNDGRGEVVCNRPIPRGVSVHRSHPRGTITTALLDYIPGVNPVDIAVADLDRDGKQDLAIVDQDNDTVVFLRGLGEGKFERLADGLAVPAGPRHIVATHLDDDEFLDLAITNAGGTLTLWYGAQGGVFPGPAEQMLSAGGQSGLVPGDFNNDGMTDLALLYPGGFVVLLGKPDGTLDKDNPVSHPLPSGANDMVAHYLDGDNWLDLAVCHPRYDGKTVSVFYGQGDGTFIEGDRYDTGWSTHVETRITAGDVNADGLIDLITAHHRYEYSCSVSLLEGQPGGGFLSEDIPISAPSVGDICVDDFDRDGIGDVAIATAGAQFILFGREQGGLDVEAFATLSSRITVTGIGDFDNNGRPDLVGATYGSGRYADLFLVTTLNQSKAKIHGDLAVTTVVAPNAGVAGDLVTVQWSVQNQLTSPLMGKWTDAVYLSRDDKWDIGDIRLGRIESVHSLAGNGNYGDSYVEALEVTLPGVVERGWYILVRTDATDQVAEQTVEIDNVMASPIALDLPELVVCNPGDPCPGLDDIFIEQRQALYYKLEAVEGKDLMVTLDPASGEGANELYIRYGAVPTRSVYDAMYLEPFTPAQTARIPGTGSGTYYVLAYADRLPPGGASPFNIRAEYLPLELTQISPDRGGNTGRVTVTFAGSGFDPDIQVALLPYGSGEIQSVRNYFYDASSFAATFDLDDQLEAACALRLTNPNGEEVLVAEAFTIEQGTEYELDVRMTGSRQLRPSQSGQYDLFIKNRANVDVPVIVVYISVPDLQGTEGRMIDITIDPPDQLSDPPPVTGFNWATYNPKFSYDGRLYYPLVLHDLAPSPAGASRFGVPPQGDLQFTVKTGVDLSGFSVAAHVCALDYQEYESIVYGALWDLVESQKGSQPLQHPVMAVAADTGDEGVYDTIEELIEHREKFRNETFPQFIEICKRFTKWLYWSPYKIIADAAAGKHPYQAIYDAMKELKEILRDSEKLIKGTVWWKAKVDVEVRLSYDPNKKLGPYAFGFLGFSRPGLGIPYRVLFENLSAASAAALKVEVFDQLDQNLDWSTLQLEEIGFGETVIRVPEGLSHYQGRVKINGWTWNEIDGWHQYDSLGDPVMPLVVDVEAGIDIDTGQIFCTIECAAPATGYYPEDVFAGFLPPNQEAIYYPDPSDPDRLVHPGEGHISFSVMPYSDLPTGTEIRNKASIVFDWNPPMETNEVLTTIDADSPSVLPLPPIADAGGPYKGVLGKPVVFDASNSYDPDGVIVLYEWDWENDGIFDYSTTDPICEHTWDVEFSGIVNMRVTDNDGFSSVGTAIVVMAGPGIETLPANNVGQTSATLCGRLIDDGGEACQYRFRYCKEGGADCFTPWSSDFKTAGESFCQDVSGLTRGSKYYFFAQVKNSGGNDTGGLQSFTTLSSLLQLEAPHGGTYAAGERCLICWKADPTLLGRDVLIEYSTDNGVSWDTIGTVTNGDDWRSHIGGHYSWYPPAVNSDQCLVRISDTSDPSIFDVSDSTFSILMQAVPDVIGLVQADAEAAITAASLAVGTISYGYDNAVPAGEVMDQYPAAGTPVAAGSAVDLAVSAGPFAAGPPAVETEDAVNIGASSATLRGVVTDDGGGSCRHRFWYHEEGGDHYDVTPWSSEFKIAGESFSQDIYGLTPGTKYFFWAQVKNSAGNGAGDLKSLTTLDSLLQLEGPHGGTYRAGSRCLICWKADAAVSEVLIECSTDNGGSWSAIDTVVNGDEWRSCRGGHCSWQVPAVSSDECLVRISDTSDPSVFDVSESTFSVVP